jgi:hypothetical protein
MMAPLTLGNDKLFDTGSAGAIIWRPATDARSQEED